MLCIKGTDPGTTFFSASQRAVSTLVVTLHFCFHLKIKKKYQKKLQKVKKSKKKCSRLEGTGTKGDRRTTAVWTSRRKTAKTKRISGTSPFWKSLEEKILFCSSLKTQIENECYWWTPYGIPLRGGSESRDHRSHVVWEIQHSRTGFVHQVRATFTSHRVLSLNEKNRLFQTLDQKSRIRFLDLDVYFSLR